MARRKMLNTFDREPNKPINAATVLQQVRRQVAASKFCIGRALRVRPNGRTFDKVQQVLDQLHADGKVKTYIGGTLPYYETPRRAVRRSR